MRGNVIAMGAFVAALSGVVSGCYLSHEREELPDASNDGGTADAGVPCTCPAIDHGTATCEAGACQLTCDPGFREADGACVALVSPRPIAPLSTATATSQRPTFRWELPPGADGARIELCRDRACDDVITTVDASGTTGRPPSDLPSGVVFWRLYARAGGEVGTTPSVTWEVFVGPRSAPVDTSFGTVLDVNGDGRADLAISTVAADGLGTAGIDVYLGSPDGLVTTPATHLDIADATGTPGDDPGIRASFGMSLASAGDVDGDGFADLVVTAVAATHCRDAVSVTLAAVYRGSAAGLGARPDTLLFTPCAGPSGGSGWDGAHYAASAGDVNRDGYADLVVYGPDGPDVYAFVFLGGARGPSATPATRLHGTWPRNFSGTGSTRTALIVESAGDVDGDGFGDVVVGAPGTNRADVFFGSASGIRAEPGATLMGGPDFGSSVAPAGDVDGDGFNDLLVAGGTDGPTLYLGSAMGVLEPGHVLEPGSNEELLRAGDVDGDGFGDFVTVDDDIHLYRGRPGDVTGQTPTTVSVPHDGGLVLGGLGAGDVDGDGFTDLVISFVPTTDAAGRVYVFRGSAAGLEPSPAQEWSTRGRLLAL